MIETNHSKTLKNNKKYINFENLSYPAKKAIIIIEEIDIKRKLNELNKIVSLLEKIKNKCC